MPAMAMEAGDGFRTKHGSHPPSRRPARHRAGPAIVDENLMGDFRIAKRWIYCKSISGRRTRRTLASVAFPRTYSPEVPPAAPPPGSSRGRSSAIAPPAIPEKAPAGSAP